MNIRLLEIAAERYRFEKSNSVDILKFGATNNIMSPFDGGTAGYAMSMLFNEKVSPLDYTNYSLASQIRENPASGYGHQIFILVILFPLLRLIMRLVLRIVH